MVTSEGEGTTTTTDSVTGGITTAYGSSLGDSERDVALVATPSSRFPFAELVNAARRCIERLL
ncbi:hypothetical protein D9611_013714 [Ephemerocybe angulata]|uniref:Uncharacterized protein n=1 Tax=Ephemerocybe angulata TaxID=980116 RepID=A0A8H5BCE0_9AGAR|nr:hypothetical protein D9611_013712 [Tulosesus angulatus]KAF5320649.1 hypothetical protein D9611_013714 [Tulosesus angulatus]